MTRVTHYTPEECLSLVKQSLAQLEFEEFYNFFNCYEDLDVDFEQNIFNSDFAITDHFEMYYHPLLEDDYDIHICECYIKHLNQYFYFRVDIPKHEKFWIGDLDVYIVKEVEVVRTDYEVIC